MGKWNGRGIAEKGQKKVSESPSIGKATRGPRARVAQKEKGVKNAHHSSVPTPKPQAKDKRKSMPKISISFPPSLLD
jgi:hypothetical protein